MIKSILLATDGSGHAWCAWKHALDIAKAYAADLRVISVVDARVLHDQMAPIGGGIDPLNLEAAHTMQLEIKLEADRSRLLAEVAQMTAAAGVQAHPMLYRGIPAEEIIAHDGMVDLIALGHRGNRSPWDRLMMGSVAAAVVRKSAQPVLMAPERHAPVMKILAAYDGSEPSQRALRWAAELAATLQLALAVAHVARDRAQAHMILGEAQAYLRPYELPSLHTIVRAGHVPKQILESADEYGAGLIVMGAHGHGRLREALLGSITEAVMQRTQKPLLLTR